MTIIDLVRPNAAMSRYWLIALLLLITAVALAVVGAFGSYVVMTLPVRLVHFLAASLAIGALAFALSHALRRYVFAGVLPFWATALVALTTAPLGALIIQQSLWLLAPRALQHVFFVELTGQVLLVNLFVGSLTWMLLQQPSKTEDALPARTDELMNDIRAKLPSGLRQAPILSLSSEDHYVRVRTDKGQALILMNLVDAIDALGPEAGIRIHRSHWVSRTLAAGAAVTNGRNSIQVDDATVLPVSRAGRKLLIELQG